VGGEVGGGRKMAVKMASKKAEVFYRGLREGS
jgi:hypothetical protein